MSSLDAGAKRRFRRVADRIVAPYVRSIVEEVRSVRGHDATASIAAPADDRVDEAAVNGTSDFFHLANHELRTIELERVPKGARRVLSVGANGRWYFDWFEAAVGEVDEHIGVEAYEPRPDDLPGYVTWVPDTADHMSGVEERSVDMVFAGQTTEHLWSAELSGFLEEAHRVLRDGGTLILDSPNRLVTEHLHWSHGGHTVELSPAEIRELVALAGFEVESLVGIWRCELDGRWLQLEEGLSDPAVFIRRSSTARDEPDASFVWWLQARKAAEPDREQLRRRTRELYSAHWNTRICRGLTAPGDPELPLSRGASGVVGRTLPFPLRPGRFELSVRLARGEWSDAAGLHIDVVAAGGTVVHRLALENATQSDACAVWRFDQDHLLFATVIEVHVDSVRNDAALAAPFDLRSDV